jgi:hypothetical protein
VGKKSKQSVIANIIGLIINLTQTSWLNIIDQLWQSMKRIQRGVINTGLYEVLEYETNLEILDRKGKKARVHKRQKVKYLQDNIIAYQDQAWGDGNILLNYQCSPGKCVDQYRVGHKNQILISLQEIKNKGDIDEFNICWKWKNGFLSNTEYWGTHIIHRTKNVRVNILFPKSRPPMRVWLFTSNQKKSKVLGSKYITRYPDGRRAIVWEKRNPNLFENYLIKWEW